MSLRQHERREQVLAAAESAPATTWLEAAGALLDKQGATHREALNGSFLDRGEARRHLLAIDKIKKVLESTQGLPKRKVPYEATTDTLVRRMRRADLLCPKGWRDGIRKKLVDTADASEAKYLETGNDQDIVDAQELRDFVTELDWIANRGEQARQTYMQQKKVVNG